MTKTPDEEIREFNEKFVQSQEPLGEEFAKILYDNLWDLYEESPPCPRQP